MVILKLSVLSIGALSLDLNGGLPIMIKNPANTQRTFAQLEDLAAEVFTADPEIPGTFTAESWSEEYMNYGCYCNKVLRGGGKLPAFDHHENICMELYACYKCINIDYDHEGTYAATQMVYEATINQTTNELECLDDLHPITRRVARHTHDMEHSGVNPDNCPRHVCECDKNFLINILEYQKKCNSGETEYCLNDAYHHQNGWVPKQNCLGIGANVVDHDGCCGRYPERKPFVKSEKKCCNNVLTLSTIC